MSVREFERNLLDCLPHGVSDDCVSKTLPSEAIEMRIDLLTILRFQVSILKGS